MQSYLAANTFYPDNALKNGLTLYSDCDSLIRVYCYNPSGQANSILGNTLTGYLWINYTLSENMPTVYYNRRVASFTAGYS